MKLPKKLRIAGHDVEVVEIDLLNNSNNTGQFLPQSDRIEIDKTVSKDVKRSTLMHEIIEAINHYYVLNLKHEKILVLETAFFEFMKSNKEIKWNLIF